ncbi:conjugative transposon protein TraK [Rhodocytophaga rosea]|uniref:Conjugative transposon protein TraK n=1 Tax=Rhodocytophaga rosea TaxID=2704465 RepID=A0A6C0GTG8_9BACT|nr:conjugative transposon protein TraK [Rhodocytophaga rosea]QHT70750.1 conjugative transposon protein TraK [Rhodocytophaga rosea]
MIRSLKNIDSSFQQIKFIVIAFLLFISCVTLYIVYASYQSMIAARDTIFILDNGSILAAKAQNIQENRPVEAREHVKRFHEYFFTLSPDERAINHTVEKALFLADESVKREYDNLKEKGFYNGVIAGNISQNVRIDSVLLDVSVYPYYVKCIGKLEIIRTSSVTLRNLVSECYLRDVVRSDNNPHGFLLENWRVIDNADIKTISR